MARIRSIHPDACKSERLAETSAQAERCYWRLQTHCDDDGRAEDNVRLIWAALFPLHEDVGPAQVDEWLCELHKVGLILRYEVGGVRYLEVTQWGKYQHPQKRRMSDIPAPDENATRPVRERGDTNRVQVEPGVGVGVGVGEQTRSTSTRRTGCRIPEVFEVTERMAEWAAAECPDVVVGRETQKFVNHWKAKPGKNGTKLDWQRTWQNWLLTAQGDEERRKSWGPARK